MPIQTPHPQYDRWFTRWARCRDAVEGSHAIKEAGEVYLPKLSAHRNPKDGLRQYIAYKARALWFGATDRTLNGYVGAIMRRSPSVVVPDAICERIEDITDAGQTATEFCHTMVKELLTTGRLGLLVDKVAEQGEDPEPAFIKLYIPENILNWRTNEEGDLINVVLAETISVPKPTDYYTLEEVRQLRELFIDGLGNYSVRVYEQARDKDGKLTEQYVENVSKSSTPVIRSIPMKEIPFRFVSCDKDNMGVSKPPILDLVDANVNHYQLDADYRHGLHFTALPTPVFTGVSNAEDYYLGSEVAINMQNENSKAFFLEFQGMGLSAIKEAMEERKAQMAALGASLIQASKSGGKGVETAEAARISHAGETSLLSTICGRVEEGLENALEIVAMWEGVLPTEDSIEVTLNRDFIDSTLSAADITSLVGAWQAGTLPTSELYWNYTRGGVVDPTTTLEEFEKAVGPMPDPVAQALALAKATAKPAPDSSGGGKDGPGPNGASGSGPTATGSGKTAPNKED